MSAREEMGAGVAVDDVQAELAAALRLADKLHAALEHIRNTAAVMATSSKTPAAMSGFSHLSALAAEALEEAT